MGLRGVAADEAAPAGVQLISLTVNGRREDLIVDCRRTLADVLREELELTGTHLGCEHGVCGACTVLLDGLPIRSCLMFAVQADDREVRTVEGLAANGVLDDLQEAFDESDALQCGYCTPGFLMLLTGLLQQDPEPTDDVLRETLGSNLCRCTGYEPIARAVRVLLESRRGMKGGGGAG